jgi:hypothetical protein
MLLVVVDRRRRCPVIAVIRSRATRGCGIRPIRRHRGAAEDRAELHERSRREFGRDAVGAMLNAVK